MQWVFCLGKRLISNSRRKIAVLSPKSFLYFYEVCSAPKTLAVRNTLHSYNLVIL